MNRTPVKSLIAIAAWCICTLAVSQSPAEKRNIAAPKAEKQAPEMERNLQVFDTMDFMKQLGPAK
jgi:hypothetical protein